MQNKFETIGAESAIDSLAVINPLEIYSQMTGQFLAQIVEKPKYAEIIAEGWGNADFPDVRFCVYRKGSGYVTPLVACFDRESAIEYCRKNRLTLE